MGYVFYSDTNSDCSYYHFILVKQSKFLLPTSPGVQLAYLFISDVITTPIRKMGQSNIFSLSVHRGAEEGVLQSLVLGPFSSLWSQVLSVAKGYPSLWSQIPSPASGPKSSPPPLQPGAGWGAAGGTPVRSQIRTKHGMHRIPCGRYASCGNARRLFCLVTSFYVSSL